MEKSRRGFIFRSVQIGIFGAFARIIAACGGGGGYSSGGGTSGGNCSANGTSVSIGSSGGHTHPAPTISASDVNTGSQQVYTLADGGAGHTHTVTVSAVNFSTLQGNTGVSLTSSVNGHSHSVTINCA